MTIKHEELDRSEVDFSDVVFGRWLRPVHPGEILNDEFLEPMGISVWRFSQAIKVSRACINDFVLGRSDVTTDTAPRLGRYFGMMPEFWINLQTCYDLDVAECTMGCKIEREIEPCTAIPAPATRARRETMIWKVLDIYAQQF